MRPYIRPMVNRLTGMERSYYDAALECGSRQCNWALTAGDLSGGDVSPPAKALLLLDWLSTRPNGVGIVRATGKSDRKLCIDDGLHNVFHYWRTFRIRRLAVVPNHAFLLRQGLQRIPKGLHSGW